MSASAPPGRVAAMRLPGAIVAGRAPGFVASARVGGAAPRCVADGQSRASAKGPHSSVQLRKPGSSALAAVAGASGRAVSVADDELAPRVSEAQELEGMPAEAPALSTAEASAQAEAGPSDPAAAAAMAAAAFAVAKEAAFAEAASAAVKEQQYKESIAAGLEHQLQYPSCPKWRRVLLKVSGEALAGDGTSNIDPKVTAAISQEVAMITRLGVQVAIVVGGGNFFRGAAWAGASGLDRASADHIGMMATVMNAIFLQGSLEAIGVPTRVQTAFKMSEVAEPYIRRRAIRHLEKGRVVIFAAGTGNPFFTTDTAAALRAAEIDAEVVLKGTNVDGVYDSDPKKNPDATLLESLSLREVTVQNLRVMDITAATLCAENNIPVVVFNLNKPGNITRALSGEPIGTTVSP